MMVEAHTRGESDEFGNPSVRLCEIVHHAGSCGFNLSKSKWDPYPWVSTVDTESPAAAAGVLSGDCVLEVNGEDILGLRVAEVANKIRSRGDRATVMLWNPGIDNQCTPETLCCGPMPTNLQRLTTCMSNILASLECPICLETTTPPTHQCANGHLICTNCRIRTERCPVCRLRFFRGRSLLADQIFESMIDAFDLSQEDAASRTKLLHQRIYGPRKKGRKSKPEIKFSLLSPTNKFLTRIMGKGKSSSVENLSARPSDIYRHEKPEFCQGLKAKSLSSSEIFQDESKSISRTSSVLSSRPGSGLLDINGISPGMRPASYHGSAGDLHTRMLTDFGIDITFGNDRCWCPMVPDCRIQIPPKSLKRHLEDKHGGPIVQFYSHRADVPSSWFIVSQGVVIMECYEKMFFVRITSNNAWFWVLEGNANNFKACCKIDCQSISCGITSLVQLENSESIAGTPIQIVGKNEMIELLIERST